MIRIDNVLYACDFTPCALHALPLARDLAARAGAVLHVLFVETLSGDTYGPPRTSKRHDRRVADELSHLAARGETGAAAPVREGFGVRAAVVHDVAPAPAILAYARGHDVDVVALGTHGRRGLRHMLLGSVAEEVVRRAECAVLTVGRIEHAYPGNVQGIVVPVDFSEHAREALRTADGLAHLFGATLEVVHVVDVKVQPAFYNEVGFAMYEVTTDVEARVREHLDRFVRETVEARRPVRTDVFTGNAAAEIARFAHDRAADLVVMSTHGLTGLEHFVLGDVAAKLVRSAPCPVLTVKAYGKTIVKPGSRRERPASGLLQA